MVIRALPIPYAFLISNRLDIWHNYQSGRQHFYQKVFMPDTTVEQVRTNQQIGDTQVVREQVSTSNPALEKEHAIAKSSQVFWYIAHLITILLGLRFVFLLLGANMTGIVRVIYDLSSIFVVPFRGIFPQARMGESFFDSAALLGIVMYYLLAFLITKAFSLFSHETES